MIAYLTMILINLFVSGGQPYSLTLTTVSDRMVRVCRLDPNCQDIETIENRWLDSRQYFDDCSKDSQCEPYGACDLTVKKCYPI